MDGKLFLHSFNLLTCWLHFHSETPHVSFDGVCIDERKPSSIRFGRPKELCHMNLVERFMGFDNLEYSALLITSGPTIIRSSLGMSTWKALSGSLIMLSHRAMWFFSTPLLYFFPLTSPHQTDLTTLEKYPSIYTSHEKAEKRMSQWFGRCVIIRLYSQEWFIR